MATRSTIAVQTADGTVRQVYAHWDGYLEHNGRILAEHYDEQELVEALVEHGDISSLRAKINPEGSHSFDDPQEDVTVYYGRDRGEKGTEFRSIASVTEYQRSGQREEYDYLFSDGVWTVRYYGTGDEWVELAPVLARALAREAAMA
jgi:hypothetical protein